MQVERSLRVRGDLHIGGVMIQLVDSLGNNNLNPRELLGKSVKGMQFC